ncbi:MAG TPA: ROK family protein [Streptosporangiaceae bacterium]|nr:ROK family protein [Streptosporangiaceae bacterium]
MAHSQVVLGIDFGGTKIAAAVCGPAGERLASTTVPSDGELGARVSLNRGIDAARDLLARAAHPWELAAVGVSTFGIPLHDRVELAPAIDGWGELALGKELRAAFPGVPVEVATDAKAAAYAEAQWGALANCDPGVYLNLGTGLSAALVIGGKVVTGAHGAAGEIGYNLRTWSDVGVPLAARVPLEDMVSGQALARRAAKHTSYRQPITAGEVFQESQDDPGLDRLVADFVSELAFHVVNLAITLNPVRIAVGGGMVGSWERLRPGLQQALNAGVPFPPELVAARFPSDAPLIGAVALAVDALRGGSNWTDGKSVSVSSTMISEGLRS